MPDLLGPEAAAAREAARLRNSRASPPIRPLPEGVHDTGRRYSIAEKAQALALYQIGMNSVQIGRTLNLDDSTIRAWIRTAKSRGWEGAEAPLGDRRRILTQFVEAGTSPGRPKEVTKEIEEKVLASVRKDSAGREKSSEVLGYEAGWSSATVLRILKKHGLKNVKPTRKPGLSREQQLKRLAFALEHKDWTLEDWKNVIWSDETSVILGHRRGSVRLWRTPEEAYEKSTVRRRWKGFSEFMFWGCFSYDKIGPCHIWEPETSAMKKEAAKEIEELNKIAEPLLRAEFEISHSLRRTYLNRQAKGKKPTWRWTEANGKLIRKGKGGIDWYRYWKEILLSHLIPFAQECQKERPGTVV